VRKRILSIWISVCMVLTMLPISVMAKEENTSGGSGEIIAFASLDKTEMSVSAGTAIKDLGLPETLTATVRTAVTADSGTSGEPVQDSTSGNSAEVSTNSAIQGKLNDQQESTSPEWKETTVDVPVTWTSTPEYNGNENGDYVFTPVIEGYTVSAELPEITVTVGTQSRMMALRVGTTTTFDFCNATATVSVKPSSDPTWEETSYSFAGWYTMPNGEGTELSGDGENGTTYYAKWTNNGKTVRTTALDLTDISESKLYDSTKSGDVYTNAAEGWTWYAAQTTVGSDTYAVNTLVLSGLNINTAATATALKVPDGTTIVLADSTTSTVKGGNAPTGGTYGIYGAGSLNINGGGTLGATAGMDEDQSDDGKSNGIFSNGALTIYSGTVTGTGGEAASTSMGIFSNGALTIHSGTVTGIGAYAMGSGGIVSNDSLTIHSGTVTGIGGKCFAGYGICSVKELMIDGGNVTGSSDALTISYGIYTSSTVITGGTVTAKSNTEASNVASAIETITVLTIGSAEKPATIANATDGTNAITSSSGSIASKKLVMSGSDAVKVSFATYAITANTVTNGSYTVKVDGSAVTSAQSGDTVAITPAASSGYELDAISVYKTGEANITVAVNNNTFTMPDYAVTIDVTFKAASDSLDLTGVGYDVAAGKLTGTTANMEYSLDGGSTWKPCTQGETTNLTFIAGTVKVRQKDKTTNERTVATIAAPAASTTPTLDGKTADSVTLNVIAGYEYSKDGGATWQDSNIFSDLNSSTTYSFVARIKATAATLPGTTSAALNVTTNGTSSGGDGGSTGGGSSSNTPSKRTEPVSGSTENKATVDDKGNASVSLTDSNITDAIANAKAAAAKKGVNAGDITAIIHVTTSGKNTNTVTVNLPKTTQEQVIGNKVSDVQLVIGRSDLTIGIDLAAVTEINRQANTDVQLFATRMDNAKLSGDAKAAIGNRPTFDFKATYGSGKTVTNFGNGSVSVEIPYTLQKGEIAGNVYAVYVDTKGKVTYLTASSYDAKRGTVVFSTNHFSTYGVACKVSANYTDINGHWAKNDILFAANRGLITGTSAATFSPNGSMTRGMFVTALGRLANADTSAYKQSSFSDVKADAYYMGYIEWAVKNNILAGMGGGKFNPDGLVTREQMAVIMDRYATAIGFKLPEVHAQNTFADNTKIDAWAAPSVKRIQMAGILQGKNNNFYDPQGTATRAEVSAALRRFVELTVFSNTAQGWVKNDSGQWMFFKDGKALTGWQTIDGMWYYFYADGSLAMNTKIDSYQVDENGVRKTE